MARKASESEATHGFNDIVGVALLAAALLLLVAQWSFDRNDIYFNVNPVNHPPHNRIGLLGAYLAWASFFPLGVVGYLVPILLAVFGAGYLLNFLSYLRERLGWSILWASGLLISLTGLLYIMGEAGMLGSIHIKIV